MAKIQTFSCFSKKKHFFFAFGLWKRGEGDSEKELSFFLKRKEVGTGRSNLGRFRFLRKKRKTKSIMGANIVNIFIKTKFLSNIFEN